jgi:hypothetical protein
MPENMSSRRARRAAPLLLSLAALAVPMPAAAQAAETPPAARPQRLLVGVDLAGIFGPTDSIGFFNYTDYEHNALRLARIQLSAEWRPRPFLSFVGQVRTEDADGVQLSAAYARIRPFARYEFDIQAGRIPPVVGAFNRRAYGRDNPLIGLPLAYQYLTSLRPDALPATADDLLRMRARGWQPSFPIGSTSVGPGMPLISASKWSTGIGGRWQMQWLEFAGAWSLGAPGVPVASDLDAGRQLSGHVTATLPAGLIVGVSGARGRWINDDALALVPEARRDDSITTLVATDAEYGYGPWLLRAEWLRSTYDMPLGEQAPGPLQLVSSSGFIEARRRLSARWQVAVRLDRLTFNKISGTLGGVPTPWDAPIDRAEGAVAFRATRHLDLRVGWQHNWRDAGRVRERGFPAFQALYWF